MSYFHVRGGDQYLLLSVYYKEKEEESILPCVLVFQAHQIHL